MYTFIWWNSIYRIYILQVLNVSLLSECVTKSDTFKWISHFLVTHSFFFDTFVKSDTFKSDTFVKSDTFKKNVVTDSTFWEIKISWQIMKKQDLNLSLSVNMSFQSDTFAQNDTFKTMTYSLKVTHWIESVIFEDSDIFIWKCQNDIFKTFCWDFDAPIYNSET